MMKIRYSIKEYGDEICEFDLPDSFAYIIEHAAEEAAEEAAEDHFNNHDGWESKWPLTFVLYDEKDAVLGIYIVEREDEPQFYARDKAEEE